jgi:hypothetical protein
MDLLTSCTHHSELQAITALSLIFHNLQITTRLARPLPAGCVLTSRSLATASKSGDSFAFRAQVLPVQRISRS